MELRNVEEAVKFGITYMTLLEVLEKTQKAIKETREEVKRKALASVEKQLEEEIKDIEYTLKSL